MRQSRSPRNTSDDNLLYQNELYLGCLQSLYNLTLDNMRGEGVTRAAAPRAGSSRPPANGSTTSGPGEAQGG